jgi:hypothetical protein
VRPAPTAYPSSIPVIMRHDSLSLP